MGIGNHEGCGADIAGEHIWCLEGADSQVVPQHIIELRSILKEKVVAFGFVNDIILNSQLLYSLEVNRSCISLVDGISFEIGAVYLSVHVEVDAVSAWILRLAALGKFWIGYFSRETVAWRTT